MPPRITHELLDMYLRASGDPDHVDKDARVDLEAWEVLAGLLLDLHLVKYGYAEDGYSKHVERGLRSLNAEDGVLERIRALNT